MGEGPSPKSSMRAGWDSNDMCTSCLPYRWHHPQFARLSGCSSHHANESMVPASFGDEKGQKKTTKKPGDTGTPGRIWRVMIGITVWLLWQLGRGGFWICRILINELDACKFEPAPWFQAVSTILLIFSVARVEGHADSSQPDWTKWPWETTQDGQPRKRAGSLTALCGTYLPIQVVAISPPTCLCCHIAAGERGPPDAYEIAPVQVKD